MSDGVKATPDEPDAGSGEKPAPVAGHEPPPGYHPEAEPAVGPQPTPDAGAQYTWARTAPQVEWAETVPLEYHRLFHGAKRYRWWKPLVALVLAALYYFTLSTVFAALTIFPYLMASDEPLTQEHITMMMLPDMQRPVSLLLSLGSIILMIPAVWLALISVGLGPLGRAWSVALKIRWRLLGRTSLMALAVLVLINVLSVSVEMLLALLSGQPGAGPPMATDLDWSLAAISAVIALVLVPFQAAAEELVFRGLLMQTLGAWLRSPWFAIGIPAVLFGFSHIYDVWGWLTVVALAVCAGWITWRTGGLEAAISLHVINNLFAFGLMAVGFGGQTGQQAETGGPVLLITNLIGFALFAWWVDRDFRRRDGVRTRIDVVEWVPPLAGQRPGGPSHA